MATLSKKGTKDNVSYSSRAKELFSGLLELAASNPGAFLMVATSVTIPSTAYTTSKLLAATPASQTTSPISGAVSSYSPDGWPIINNPTTGSSTTVRLTDNPIAASKRDQFADWIRSHGDKLECNPPDHGLTYTCFIPRLEVIKGIPSDSSTRIMGAVSSYSPDGWPIIKNPTGSKTTVRLTGVNPIAAGKHEQFAAWIKSHGDYLDCDSSNDGGTYRCLTAQRLDVAQTLLLNGATGPSRDADQHYKDAERTHNIIAGSQR